MVRTILYMINHFQGKTENLATTRKHIYIHIQKDSIKKTLDETFLLLKTNKQRIVYENWLQNSPHLYKYRKKLTNWKIQAQICTRVPIWRRTI